ncbi:hypothetical protein CATRI_07340 [Corynebacterium atrinae]|nr:hypothetical protein CATRI_07340 [Corynebacterium atrinae]
MGVDRARGVLDEPDSLRRAGFVTQNPTTYVDRLGLDWWNPFSWKKDTWRNVGAGLVGVAAAFAVAAVVVGTGCGAGVGCAVGAGLLAGAVGGAAGSVAAYDLQPGRKTNWGYVEAGASGWLWGAGTSGLLGLGSAAFGAAAPSIGAAVGGAARYVGRLLPPSVRNAAYSFMNRLQISPNASIIRTDENSRIGSALPAHMSGAEAKSWASERTAQLQASLPEASRRRITMEAGLLRDSTGKEIRVISTSEPNGYLRPGVELQPGEIKVPGTGHAEADIVRWATDHGYEVVAVGAGRPICGACAGSIVDSGGQTAGQLKGGGW